MHIHPRQLPIHYAPYFRVVIAGLEVIESGISVVDVAAVAEGVMGAEGGRHSAGLGQGIAPGIVGQNKGTKEQSPYPIYLPFVNT